MVPLEQLVGTDGTLDLKSGFRGSVSTAGWRMVTQPGGAPRFVRGGIDEPAGETLSPLGILDPGDVNWDDRFNWDYGTSGVVVAAVLDGSGNLYIGGGFTRVYGVSVASVAKWDGANWSALGAGTDGSVNSLALDVSGNLYAGGGFSSAGGGSANNIAKWDGSSWSALGSGMDLAGVVRALAVDGSGNVFAGGDFTTAGGVSASRIAKWDGSSWSALGAGVSYPFGPPPVASVYALAVDGSNVYAGGSFSFAGGGSAINVAKWDGSSWSALGSGMDGEFVYALAVDGGGNLYAGGDFTTAGGVSANRVARWNGSSWSAMGSGMDDLVYSVAVDGSGNLYAGGNFSTAGGGSANRVALWNGSSWSALGSGLYGSALCLVPYTGGKLFAGGSGFINNVGDIGASGLAMWTGSSWTGMGTGSGLGLDFDIRALTHDASGNVYAGGDFAAVGNQNAYAAARWDGTAWTSLNAGMNLPVTALAHDGTNLYAGGFFTTAGGGAANYVAKWNGTSWSALGSGTDDWVYALAVDGSGNLYAGGVSGNVAKWDGANWSPLGSGMDGAVFALVVDGSGNLYAGGSFFMADGVIANRIAKWDGASWSALGTGMSGNVRALAVDGSGNLYTGGSFTLAGGVSASRVAKWNGTSWSALGTGVNNTVFALSVDGSGNLYAGGNFVTAGGGSANRIAKWNGTSWSALGSGLSNPYNIQFYTRALTVDGSGNVHAGGGFTSAGGKPSSHFAIWRAPLFISATAGAGGTISPSGSVSVVRGSDQMFSITPDFGYTVADVLVDGNSAGSVTSYTFTNVQGSHAIAASFSSLTDVGTGPVTEFALTAVAPNPAIQRVRIDYSVAREARVRLSVTDVQGRTVATLANEVRAPGRYRIEWGIDGALNRAPAGMYFIRYEAPGLTVTRSVLLVR